MSRTTPLSNPTCNKEFRSIDRGSKRYEEYPNTLLVISLAAPVDPDSPNSYCTRRQLRMALIQLVTPACTLCEKTSTLELDSEDIAKWKDGALIQDVWPDLTPAVRELLISGTHPECWDSLFGALENDNEIEFFEAVFEAENERD